MKLTNKQLRQRLILAIYLDLFTFLFLKPMARFIDEISMHDPLVYAAARTLINSLEKLQYYLH